MSVIPAACNVAAVVKIMNNETAFENPIPTTVSTLMRSNCFRACHGAHFTGCSLRLSRTSSASSDACQKNRYGLMVVPSTATSAVKYATLNVTEGTKVERNAGPQATRATNGVSTYANSAMVSHFRYFTYCV